MRLDSHQHFWQYNPDEHVWMNDQMEILKKDYLPKDLEPSLRETGFDGTIAVQARQMVHETEWLLELAGRHEIIKGVVGWVDLCSDRINEQLEKYSENSKLKGVRHVLQEEPDDFMLGKAFQNGIAQLKRYNLTYDLLVFPRQLSASINLVEKFPEQLFVIDHIAKPDIKNKVVKGWEEDMKTIAGYSNVYCKLSGMVTETHWHNWSPEEFKVYIDIVINAFGDKRIMVGSDWPVCILSGDYKSVMEIVTKHCEQFSKEEQDNMLGTNCAQFYNL